MKFPSHKHKQFRDLEYNTIVLCYFLCRKNPAIYRTSTQEEAARIWGRLATENKTLAEVMQDIELQSSETDSFLDKLSAGIEIPLESESIFACAVVEKRPLNITDADRSPMPIRS